MKTINLLMATIALTGCVRPYANFAVETTGESMKMKSQTISTQLAENYSALARNTLSIVNAMLVKDGWKFVPHGGQITMTVDAWRGQKSMGQSVHWRPFGASSEEEYEDVVTIQLQARKGQHAIWDGMIEGRGEYLSGKYAPGCIRTLLDRYQMHESGEESCYRLDQMQH